MVINEVQILGTEIELSSALLDTLELVAGFPDWPNILSYLKTTFFRNADSKFSGDNAWSPIM